jgi:hypothetical protein
MNQDENNLNTLSLFHYILGAITALGSFVYIIHIVLGVLFIVNTFKGPNAPPEAIGFLFVVLGSLALLFGLTVGILMIIAGRKLRRHVSRTFCIAVAAIECLLTPLGTILGVFTIVTLMKESVIALFHT